MARQGGTKAANDNESAMAECHEAEHGPLELATYLGARRGRKSSSARPSCVPNACVTDLAAKDMSLLPRPEIGEVGVDRSRDVANFALTKNQRSVASAAH
jgi:hypothetical protein